MYSRQVLDHFERPRNAGELPGATTVVDATNPVCGDILRVAVIVENGKVKEARFKAQGCVAAMACGSYVAEWMVGKSAAEMSRLRAEDVAEAMGGLPQASAHASELACDAVRMVAGRMK
jgi:nitrogen fixation protein NifU and related proteins